MSEVQFSFDIGEHGWATFELAIGTRAITLDSLSYCTDVLGDLVRLAVAVSTGATRASTFFDSGPLERRLIVQRDVGHTGNVTVRILELPDVNKAQPDADGLEVFSAYCQGDELARSIMAAAEEVLSRYGEDGYRQVWTGDQPFPLRALEALRAALTLPRGGREI